MLFNNILAAADKMLVSEIRILQKSKGCYASNAHFAQMLGVGERRVREMIANLAASEVLRVENGTSKRRRLFLGERAEVHTFPKGVVGEDSAGAYNLPPLEEDGAGKIGSSPIPAGTVRDQATTTRHESASLRQEPSSEPGRVEPSNLDDKAPATRTETPTEITPKTHGEKKKKEQEELKREFGVFVPGAIKPDLWRRWVQHNEAQGRRLTSSQMESQIADIGRLFHEGYVVDDIINKAISANWKTFYPPNTPKQRRWTDFDGEPRRGKHIL
ncbi:hypothetical protein KZ813_15245 [Sphingomonas sp. RHCKR7]|uniref:hypothetical protein n=1 Tax=Sphingomonas folli TaxID=2862497 RepID=UPI001CA4EB57|nr:hypothetical protein [Sphingomonas folli]MBW6528198.1 hypothetical protein [Sphingomonas folli]